MDSPGTGYPGGMVCRKRRAQGGKRFVERSGRDDAAFQCASVEPEADPGNWLDLQLRRQSSSSNRTLRSSGIDCRKGTLRGKEKCRGLPGTFRSSGSSKSDQTESPSRYPAINSEKHALSCIPCSSRWPKVTGDLEELRQQLNGIVARPAARAEQLWALICFSGTGVLADDGHVFGGEGRRHARSDLGGCRSGGGRKAQGLS